MTFTLEPHLNLRHGSTMDFIPTWDNLNDMYSILQKETLLLSLIHQCNFQPIHLIQNCHGLSLDTVGRQIFGASFVLEFGPKNNNQPPLLCYVRPILMLEICQLFYGFKNMTALNMQLRSLVRWIYDAYVLSSTFIHSVILNNMRSIQHNNITLDFNIQGNISGKWMS